MKKYLITLLVGIILFFTGITCFYLETRNYKEDKYLTANFSLEKTALEYDIYENQIFKITNDKTNKNMNIYIDNSLNNKIQIVVVHSDMLEIKNNYSKEKDLVNIDLDSNLIIKEWNDVVDIYSLAVTSFTNKTIYNYTLLKYPEIRIYVNENNLDNIRFVKENGKIYNPSK